MANNILIETTTNLKTFQAKGKDKAWYLEGVLSVLDTKNQNGRIYPRSLMESSITELKKASPVILGSLGHKKGEFELQDVCVKVESLEIVEENDTCNVVGKLKVLNTPDGLILQNLLSEGVPVGISTRGIGTQDDNGVVNDDYKLLSFDVVQSPSTGKLSRSVYESLLKDEEKFNINDYLKRSKRFKDGSKSMNEESELVARVKAKSIDNKMEIIKVALGIEEPSITKTYTPQDKKEYIQLLQIALKHQKEVMELLPADLDDDTLASHQAIIDDLENKLQKWTNFDVSKTIVNVKKQKKEHKMDNTSPFDILMDVWLSVGNPDYKPKTKAAKKMKKKQKNTLLWNDRRGVAVPASLDAIKEEYEDFQNPNLFKEQMKGYVDAIAASNDDLRTEEQKEQERLILEQYLQNKQKARHKKSFQQLQYLLNQTKEK